MIAEKYVTARKFMPTKNGHTLPSLLEAEKEASFTVEAALVMMITLFLIASLLTEAFNIHGQVAGDMVLQDAMEQWCYRGEEETERELVGTADRRLKSYFWCGDKQLDISESGRRINGTVKGGQESDISVKVFEPEKILRLLRAVGL